MSTFTYSLPTKRTKGGLGVKARVLIFFNVGRLSNMITVALISAARELLGTNIALNRAAGHNVAL